MNAKENKALVLAAMAAIILGQPALARGGGLGSGFGGGFSGGMHGLGDMGVHGLSGGFSSSMHEGGNGKHGASNFDNNHDNDNSVNNNFESNHSWAQNHPYEAAGAADYAFNHGAGNYGAYGYGAPYGYFGGLGIFPDIAMVIDEQNNQQPAPVVQQNNPPAAAAAQAYNPYATNAEQQEIMRQRARIFAQELVGALGQRYEAAPQAVNNSFIDKALAGEDQTIFKSKVED